MSDLNRVRRSFYVLTAFRWLPVGAVTPFSVLLLQERGLGLDEIGLVAAFYGVTVAMLELPTGGLADVIGRRPVLLFAEIFTGLGFGLFLFSQTWALFAAAWTIMGVGRALNSGALEAWFVDEAHSIEPEMDLHRPLSVAGIVGAVALGIGSIAGGFLPKLIDSGFTIGGLVVTELAIPMLAAVVFEVLHVIAIWLLVIEAPRRPEGGRIRAAFLDVIPTVTRGVKLGATHPIIRNLLLVMVAIGLVLSSVEILWQPFFADLAGGSEGRTELFGIVSFLGFAAAGAGSGLSPAWVRLARGKSAIAGMLGVLAAGLFLSGLALSGAIPIAGAAYVAIYVFVGILGPLHNDLLHRQVSSEERSTMLSANSLGSQVGGVIGTVGIASIAAAASITVGWVIAAGIASAASLFYLAIHRRMRQKAPEAT